MRHNSILSILAKGLMAAAVAVSIPAVTWAQGITVKTKDGKSVDYPAEKFSHISPYIFSSNVFSSSSSRVSSAFFIASDTFGFLLT